MATYYGYARISSDGQSKFSIEDQEAYLKGRALDLGVPFKFRPEVGSGTTQKGRDVLSGLVAEVEVGDFIGVAFQDRFGRGGAEDIILLQSLHSRGVKIELRGRLFDPNDPLGSFSDEMMMIVSKFYSKLQGQKAKQGIKNAQRSGRYLFRGNPYGFRRTDTGGKVTISIDEAEATVIRLIKEKVDAGYSYPKIAEQINAAGYRVRSGKPFSASYVTEFIYNPLYCGFYHPEPTLLKCGKIDRNHLVSEELVKSVYYPAIIEPAEWWKTYLSRRVIQSRYETYKKYQKRPNEITGILQCGHCATKGLRVAYIHAIKQIISPKHGLTSHGPIYTSRIHSKGCPVMPKSFRAEVLEGLFRTLLVMTFERPEEIKAFVVAELAKQRRADTEAAKEIQQLQQVLGKRELQRERLTEAIMNSGENVLDLLGKRKEVLAVIDQLRKSIDKLRTPLTLRRDELEVLLQRYSLDTLQEFFGESTLGSKRKQIYLSLISSAVQDERGITVNFKNGKTYEVGVHRASGRNYQVDFLIKVDFDGIEQGEVVASYDKKTQTFTAHRLNSRGEQGDKVHLLELVAQNEFEEIKVGWDQLYSPEEKERMARPLNLESLFKHNDLN